MGRGRGGRTIRKTHTRNSGSSQPPNTIRAPFPLKMQHVVLILMVKPGNSFPISGMASGHWQATAPKDNRGAWGGAVTSLLGSLRGYGLRATRPSEDVQAAPLWGRYLRRGFSGTLFTGGTPASIGNGRIPMLMGLCKCKRSECCALGWGGLGEPLSLDLTESVVGAAENNREKGMEQGRTSASV